MNYYLNDFVKWFNSIKSENLSDIKSLNILVSAKWGRGKTTLKNELINYFNNSKILVVDVNIWLSIYQSVDEIIFASLLEKIKELKIKNWKFTIKKIYKQTIKEYKNKLLNNQNVKLSKKDKSMKLLFNLIELKEKHNSLWQSDLLNHIKKKYKINYSIEEILMFLIKKQKYERIIFLYDELDRCDKKFILNFFEKIKYFFNIENITNIIFANEDYLHEIFKNINTKGDEKFIDKYFSFKYQINSNSVNIINNFWKEIIKNDDVLIEKNSNIYKIFKELISCRDVIKKEQKIKCFMENLKIVWKRRNLITSKENILCNDFPILITLFMYLKNINEIITIDDFEIKLNEFFIINYFDFTKFKNIINNWIENYEKWAYKEWGETYVIRRIGLKQTSEETKYLFSLMYQRTIYYYFKNNMEQNIDFFEKSIFNFVTNINHIFNLFNEGEQHD